MAADLVLLDPQRVEDKATFTQPHQYSAGFDMVMVNGKIAAEQGKLTAVRSGRPLRAR
jgi:N-acyl-D-amino-acid deacylase